MEKQQEREQEEEYCCGSITVISGSMFAGKTTELQEELKKAYMARKNPTLIKHKNDSRYGSMEFTFL